MRVCQKPRYREHTPPSLYKTWAQCIELRYFAGMPDATRAKSCCSKHLIRSLGVYNAEVNGATIAPAATVSSIAACDG
eukprot:1340516-Pleurochrysis_carterae.AAC.1